VNNFVSMHVPFGLGLWWLSLGLIASLVTRYYGPTAIPAQTGGRS